jgi:hypothetical protein
MTTRITLALALVATFMLGCKSPPVSSTSSGSPQGTTPAAYSTSSSTSGSASGETQSQPIPDPSFDNMTAVTVTIPARWHFNGVLYQGGNCTPVPNPVYRATSPDGLSFMERMPPLSWVYGSGPNLKTMEKSDCLPLKGPMSAQDFLKYLAGTMHVAYVSDEPVPEAISAKVHQTRQAAEDDIAPKYAAAHMTPPKSTLQLARAIVTSKNGTFPMKGRLDVTIDCTESVFKGPPMVVGRPPQLVAGPSTTLDQCTAHVDYYSAPENQFAAVIRQMDATNMEPKSDEVWKQAWIQRSAGQAQRTMDTISRMSEQARQASAQQFNHDQAVRQQMHDQFLSTMAEGTQRSMDRAQANMNARATVASDWVDYALDRQTVADPTTGQVTKVSNAYKDTWIDTSGKNSFQANDSNANPNGYLPGTWIKQDKVHGDGSSY